MTNDRRQRATVPLRCSQCGGMEVKVGRFIQPFRRTFRRNTAQTPHDHAPCQCTACKHEWWSAHEDAVAAAQKAIADNVDFHIVHTVPVDKSERRRRRKPLSALLATVHTAHSQEP